MAVLALGDHADLYRHDCIQRGEAEISAFPIRRTFHGCLRPEDASSGRRRHRRLCRADRHHLDVWRNDGIPHLLHPGAGQA